jgi:hypothetical protein
VADAFFIPKDITLYRKRPSGVTNAEISLALSVNGTMNGQKYRSHITVLKDFIPGIFVLPKFHFGVKTLEFFLAYL